MNNQPFVIDPSQSSYKQFNSLLNPNIDENRTTIETTHFSFDFGDDIGRQNEICVYLNVNMSGTAKEKYPYYSITMEITTTDNGITEQVEINSCNLVTSFDRTKTNTPTKPAESYHYTSDSESEIDEPISTPNDLYWTTWSQRLIENNWQQQENKVSLYAAYQHILSRDGYAETVDILNGLKPSLSCVPYRIAYEKIIADEKADNSTLIANSSFFGPEERIIIETALKFLCPDEEFTKLMSPSL